MSGPGNLFDARDDDEEPLYDPAGQDDEPNALSWEESTRAIQRGELGPIELGDFEPLD